MGDNGLYPPAELGTHMLSPLGRTHAAVAAAAGAGRHSLDQGITLQSFAASTHSSMVPQQSAGSSSSLHGMAGTMHGSGLPPSLESISNMSQGMLSTHVSRLQSLGISRSVSSPALSAIASLQNLQADTRRMGTALGPPAAVDTVPDLAARSRSRLSADCHHHLGPGAWQMGPSTHGHGLGSGGHMGQSSHHHLGPGAWQMGPSNHGLGSSNTSPAASCHSLHELCAEWQSPVSSHKGLHSALLKNRMSSASIPELCEYTGMHKAASTPPTPAEQSRPRAAAPSAAAAAAAAPPPPSLSAAAAAAAAAPRPELQPPPLPAPVPAPPAAAPCPAPRHPPFIPTVGLLPPWQAGAYRH